jgi:hypothetical protein
MQVMVQAMPVVPPPHKEAQSLPAIGKKVLYKDPINMPSQAPSQAAS